MERGYLKLWRRSIDSEVFHNPNLWRLWTWCLMKTTYKDRFIPFQTGKGKISVNVLAGQFIFGRNKAAEFLGDSPSTVWRRMKKLEVIGNIKIESNKQYSIVSLCNWEEYQTEDEETGQAPDKHRTSTGQLADKHRTTSGQLADTNKKVKKDKKDKKEDITTDEQKAFASHLSEIASLRRKINITSSTLSSWSNTIRLMMDRDKISSDQITKALGWYQGNWMNEYVPVIESASSLREKWPKLLNAIERDKKPINGDTNNGFDKKDYQSGATKHADLPEFLR